MKKQPRAQVLDLTIRGDELEHDRIQLEHNLQRTDLSLQLSSQDGELNHNDSIEYPRHNSNPASLPEFRSYIHRSGDDLDNDFNHAWSYRTGDEDDEEGINPYVGETMSTAAHHASGLTLSAGLGGGGHRRDVSLSGADYDPERPLRDIMAGVDSKLSLFDMDPSRSRYPPPGGISFDPVIVDDTAELDRILASGYVPPPSLKSRSVRLRSPHTASSSSDSEEQQPRPKISDALRRVSFSPKRPRSPRGAQDHSVARHAPSPLGRQPFLPAVEKDVPTPKPLTTKCVLDASYASPYQPQVRLHPPTPTPSGSKFTKIANGINKELDHEIEKGRRHNQSSAADRTIHYEAGNLTRDQSRCMQPTPRRSSLRQPVQTSAHASKSRLHLPDVTGLTSAVESPIKGTLQHYPYQASKEARESDARLLSAISAVQSKLRELQDENGISRRRVRELEHELELCKIEVTKEHSMLMQREEFLSQQQHELELEDARRRKGKGKAKARDISFSREDTSRYQEVVEEKKALEALVTSLRSHLSRLTAELASHQQLLTELRSLRDSDHRTLKEKTTEINVLRAEVERLAGEVEVLRGVVEEGLKERRAAREASEATRSRIMVVESAIEQQGTSTVEEHGRGEEVLEEGNSAEEEDDFGLASTSRTGGAPDKTIRTDYATLGSTNLGASGGFIEGDELEQISADVEERRSEHSKSFAEQSTMLSRSPSPTIRRACVQVEDVPELDRPSQNSHWADESRSSSPSPSYARRRRTPTPSTVRPTAPTPAHAAAHSRHPNRDNDEVPQTPFPQIRGTRLERLFFSAPEHNAKTCNVCHRRRGHRKDSSPMSPSWLPNRFAKQLQTNVQEDDEDNSDEDEGFAEGSEGVEDNGRRAMPSTSAPPRVPTTKGVPPQTVLMKVIRELQDDFTHYKSVYVELADQYKDMDAVSDVPKRNMLAQHLREVIDILEQKGDQIASLTDLLTFKDKPTTESVLNKGEA
ncbi:uncharacterized protein BT62DRAFT_904157 [Guyanagaster necrorhizus]|uniref:Cep57 centrosome microtubule-binding domain-containing protein n=1 Tax=Guyanagaster necrorhizus TaxID=856835 RepID=A0A9P7VKV8_9AGAR|nr:uncharacterized protein BT62DRAFT_904157 [Guyanagaster necrorhizus MCA 3950]KAG7442993.1 hypothetical protein BT62DRAFT_904157 [Guyanagaster necrorhizus MCA 3950]